MKQYIVISLLPDKVGISFLKDAPMYLEQRCAGERLRKLGERGEALFYSEHLDLWSMGDSFERFLRPKKWLRIFDGGSTLLYTLPLSRLRLAAEPRDNEEPLLRDLLDHARRAGRRLSSETHLFVLRTVFAASGD